MFSPVELIITVRIIQAEEKLGSSELEICLKIYRVDNYLKGGKNGHKL